MQHIKRFILFFLRPVRYFVRAIVRKYPHLMPYAIHLRSISRGRFASGARALHNQFTMDANNRRMVKRDKQFMSTITRSYELAVISAVKHNVNQWWTLLPNGAFKSVAVLNTFLQEVVLRRAGDYKTYIKIREKLKATVGDDHKEGEFFDQIAEHFDSQTKKMDAGGYTKHLKLSKEKRRFVIGFYVYGDAYIDFFLQYCLASLRSPGNLEALCGQRQVVLFIHATLEGKERLETSSEMQSLNELGISVVYNILNNDLMSFFYLNPSYKYWHMGLIQSLDLYFAKTLDADYHLLVPDTIYADSLYKDVLLKAGQGYQAITRLALSTRKEGICPDMEAYRKENGAINIPATDLAAYAVKHIHKAFNSLIMTNRDYKTEAANVHIMVWEGKDTIQIASPHQTILYLDRDILRNMPRRYFMTLDNELNKIIPEDARHYTPKAEDNMVLVEATSEHERREIVDSRNSIAEFSRMFWFQSEHSMGYWRFFDNTIEDSLNREIIDGRDYMSQSDIEGTIRAVKDELLERQPRITKQQARTMYKVLLQLDGAVDTQTISPEIDRLKRKVEEEFPEVALKAKNNIDYAAKNQTKPLKLLYQEVMLCCVKHRLSHWWRFLPHMSEASVDAFHHVLTEYVLRRAGDHQEMLRIRSELQETNIPFASKSPFFDELALYFDEVAEKMDLGEVATSLALDPNKRPFVLGVSVWGEAYIDIMVNYCFPSLLADGNFGELSRRRQIVLFVHTNIEGRKILDSHELVLRMKQMGVIIQYQMINEKLVSYFKDDPSYKYWHLGLVQSLDLYLAKTLNADYHLLMPDTIYSEKHFTGILNAAERGHKAIVRLIVSTAKEGICPDIENYRNSDSTITVPAMDMASLSVKHIDEVFSSWLMTNKSVKYEMSHVHILGWEEKDQLYLHSPHQTILYLDKEVTSRIARRFFMSLDSELDKIIPADQPIYFPQPDDEMCMVEVTPSGSRDISPLPIELDQFCRMFWANVQQSMDYWRVFASPVVDRLNRDLIPDKPYMKREDIDGARQHIMQALINTYPTLSAIERKRAVKELEQLKDHPEAQHLLLQIEQTIALASKGEDMTQLLGTCDSDENKKLAS